MLQPISRKDFFEQFQIMSELSRSQYSETYLCKYRNDPLNHYVAKCFRKDKINNMGEFIKAINDVQLLKLSFMVPYEFVADDEDQHIILIRKYVNMKPINDLSPGEFQMSIVWRHIFQCYANLHDKGIGGVLVKPGNIVLFSNSLVVLVDFQMDSQYCNYNPLECRLTKTFVLSSSNTSISDVDFGTIPFYGGNTLYVAYPSVVEIYANAYGGPSLLGSGYENCSVRVDYRYDVFDP